MAKKIIAGIILTFILIFGLTGCASFERWGKDVSSDFKGGLDRTVEVYDYAGNLLKTYEGQIDLATTTEGESGKVKFDLNGKRYIIYNAIVIVEEK